MMAFMSDTPVFLPRDFCQACRPGGDPGEDRGNAGICHIQLSDVIYVNTDSCNSTQVYKVN